MKTFQHLCTAAAAFGLAAHVQAGFFAGSTDFEGESPLNDGLWSAAGDAEIQTDATVSSAASRPANYTFADNRDNVLVIDNDEPIVRSLQNGGAAASVGDGIYADVLVKGTALAYDAADPEPGSVDKLLVYFRVNDDGTQTNLCVMAAENAAGGAAEEFRLAGSVDAAEWHRVVIAAKAVGAYQIYLDGDAAANLCKTAGDKDTFYALTAGDSVSSIGFKGSGSVDDLVLSTFVPSLPVTTLTWDTSLASVSYVVGNTTNALTVADGSYQFQPSSGTAVTLIGDTGYRTVSATGTASASPLTLEVNAPTGLAWYSDGDGTQANPYEIPTFEALVAMKDAVASDASYRSAHYVQTADIDGTGKAAFAGIGTYSKVPTAGVPFTGTYDGQGHTIANITRAGENTQGIFNQVGPSGVIENLVVSNMVFASDVSGEYGFAIVGNAGGGATLRNLTAAGVFGSAEKPSTHNMAGIVVRLSPGATAGDATTIDSCTNNATIYGGYTKLGGINAIVQDQTGFKNGKVVFVNCANNGTLVCKRAATDVTGNAGIVAYFSGTNVELTGCYSNGEITNADGANTDKDGALVGWTYGGTIKDNGGNSAPSNKKMIGTWGSATETGFQYATVENGVATTIAGAPVAGGEYLLEGNAAPVIVLDEDDTVAFDTALGYTLTASGITAADASLVVVPATVGTVTTYATAARGPYLEPATQELFYNCTSVVSVVDAPEGATFYWQEEVIPGESTSTSGGISFSSDVKPLSVSGGRKADTVKFYSNTTNGIWHLTAFVTNDNAQVAQLVATVTVKDVAAVVDGVEYSRAQWSEAITAAKANDKVLGIYLSAPAVSLAAGESLQVKVLATRNVVNLPTVTGPAGTDGTVYVVNKVKDSATGVTTFSLTAEDPSVKFVSADGVMTNYLDASFKASRAGTYTLLKGISRSQLSVGTADVVLDLNGKTFTSTATGTTAAINVTSTTGTADLTVVDSSEAGTGAIVAPNYSAIQSGKNASVAIEGGAISGKTVVVYTVSGGTAAISGGTFSMVSGSASSMLNCNDSNRGTITVTGGSFNGFDPSTSNAADGDMVATGYLSFADDPSAGWYTVHPVATVTVTATGVTVTGVTDGQKVVPGTALTIGATVAEGYEPSVTITKTADSTVLLTTNAVSFAYTMPDFDITVAAEAVAIPVAEPDPVDPGSSMTAEQMAAYPPVQISGTDFKVHFVGQEGVSYQLVAADSCDLTEEQWKAADEVGQAKTTDDANADGVIELSAPMGEASAKFYKIKAFIAE